MRTTTGSTRRRHSLALAALTLAPATAFLTSQASACEVTRDPMGFYRGICKLGTDFKDRYVGQIEFAGYMPPTLQIFLPNLHPRKFRYAILGSSMEIDLDLENTGQAVAGPVDVALSVNVVDPTMRVPQQTLSFTLRTATVQPGSNPVYLFL